jgi:hypothetical protein
MRATIFLFCILLLCIGESAVGWVSLHQSIGRRPSSATGSGSSLNMGVTSTLKRVKDSVLSKERTRKDLKIGIAGFYDRSSKLWEDVWGEVCKIFMTERCLWTVLVLSAFPVILTFRTFLASFS